MREGAAPWGRLAWLAAGVFAVHLWWLQGPAAIVRPPAASVWHMRSIPPEPVIAPPAARTAPAGPAAPADADRTPHRAGRPAARLPTPIDGAARPSTAPTATPDAGAPGPLAPPPAKAQAFSIPPPARLHYQVTAQTRGIRLQGDAQLDWRHDGQQYEAQWQVGGPSVPARTQRSTGLITRDGLAPLRFSDRSRQEVATHFDRAEGKVIFSNNRPAAALQAGAQDRLGVMLQLGAMLAAAPASFPAGTSIELQTASSRDADVWVFTVQGTDTLQLPGGTVEAVKLLRMPRHEYEVTQELWLAPGQAYVPVRLRLTQPNGDWVDHQWSSTDKG